MAIFCAVVLAVTVWSGTLAYKQFYHRAPDLSGPLLVTAIMAAAQLALTQNHKRGLWWAGAVLGSAALFFATDRRTGFVGFLLCGMALWQNTQGMLWLPLFVCGVADRAKWHTPHMPGAVRPPDRL